MGTNFVSLEVNQQTELIALNLILIFALKTICLVLAFLTIRLGSKLISEGAKGEFKFSGKLFGMSTNLASVSPGLLFVLLGTVLMGYALAVKKMPSSSAGQTSTKAPEIASTNSSLPSNYPIPSNVDTHAFFHRTNEN